MDRDDWLTDPRFAERPNRKVHAEQLVTEIEAELAQKSAQEWEVVLQGAGVPCARLRSLPEALSSHQVEKRGFVQILESGVSVPTLPFRLGGASAYNPSCDAPRHGAHTDEIAARYLKSQSEEQDR